MRMATTLSVLVLGAGGVGHAVVTGLDGGIGRVDPFKDLSVLVLGAGGVGHAVVTGLDGGIGRVDPFK
ncbi:hypothetical protein ACJA3G_20070, partial [Streptomyces sp. YS-3]